MTGKEIKRQLLVTLGASLARFSYKLRKGSQTYEKPFNDGTTAFHIAFINHETDVDLTADVAIRFERLERLLYSLLSEPRKRLLGKEGLRTFSMGAELGNITQGRPQRWTIVDEADVEPVVGELIEWFENVALPYFEKYCDMRTALEVLSGDDEESRLHSPIKVERAKRAVGLAWLLEGEAQASAIIERKTMYLSNGSDFEKRRFSDFVDVLLQAQRPS